VKSIHFCGLIDLPFFAAGNKASGGSGSLVPIGIWGRLNKFRGHAPEMSPLCYGHLVGLQTIERNWSLKRRNHQCKELIE
jgi:hypothetical protein